MFNKLALAWFDLVKLVLDLLCYLLATLDFFWFALIDLLACIVWMVACFSLVCLVYLLCLIILALLASLVFALLSSFAWLSYARFGLVAKLARSLVLDFEQLLSFFLQNDGSFYC